MSETSLILEPRVDEMKATGLAAEPSQLVRPPRVAAAPAHFECLYHDHVILPGRSLIKLCGRRGLRRNNRLLKVVKHMGTSIRSESHVGR